MVILTPLPEESSSSSPADFDHNYTYDVFLNFRGADTRLNFIDHLRKALKDANIKTFFDDDGIQTGQDLKPELKNAIKASKASIIVLSKNYASSTWCLDELTLILQLQRVSNHVVIPVFYHVEPTHVRKQTGSFGDALAEHKKKIDEATDPKTGHKLAQKMRLWKEALIQVANLKGISADGRTPSPQSEIHRYSDEVVLALPVRHHQSITTAISPNRAISTRPPTCTKHSRAISTRTPAITPAAPSLNGNSGAKLM